MKKILFSAILLAPFLLNAQEIGKIADEKPPINFPDNALGIDLMIGDGGFGFGTFYRRQINNKFTFFGDISLSESKDEGEFQYYDYWGSPLPVVGKKNRVFLVPLNFGVQYRLFEKVIYDNLRPYVNFGTGPAIVITTPYYRNGEVVEFFSSFGDAHANYAVGGYVGFGANFGIDKSSLVGINFRYYLVHFFNEGVENIFGRFRKNIGGFYLTINIGMMY